MEKNLDKNETASLLNVQFPHSFFSSSRASSVQDQDSLIVPRERVQNCESTAKVLEMTFTVILTLIKFKVHTMTI